MKIKPTLHVAGMVLAVLMITACDQNASKKTLGNSQDTTSINKAGGPTIKDTATINKDRRDSAKDNTAKGNADPSGRIKNQ